MEGMSKEGREGGRLSLGDNWIVFYEIRQATARRCPALIVWALPRRTRQRAVFNASDHLSEKGVSLFTSMFMVDWSALQPASIKASEVN